MNSEAARQGRPAIFREPTVARCPADATPAQLLLHAVDACATAYGAAELGWVAEIAGLRLAHHELRLLPIVASCRQAA